ncbi:MAG TPA: SAM-dependent methyltransferase [Sporichthyaceae bacterium]|jgi:trans-aconitate methyltransferase
MSLRPDYFQRMYRADADPWGFRTRWYEQRKYALTLASLPRPRYGAAFEPGCSIGVLTAQLADRCDHLLAMDPVPGALEAARQTTGFGVETRIGAIPADWPTGSFDLIVLSEVGYYLEPRELPALATRIVGSLRPGGDLVAVHWRPNVADYPSTGDQVHAALADRPELARLVRHRESDFVLEVFRNGDATSVAQGEGLR